MGEINTCEEELIFKLPDGNCILIERHGTFEDQLGGYNLYLLKKEDLADHDGTKIKKMPIAYDDNPATLPLSDWNYDYAEIIENIMDDVYNEFKFSDKDDVKVNKMLDKILKKIKKIK